MNSLSPPLLQASSLLHIYVNDQRLVLRRAAGTATDAELRPNRSLDLHFERGQQLPTPGALPILS